MSLCLAQVAHREQELANRSQSQAAAGPQAAVLLFLLCAGLCRQSSCVHMTLCGATSGSAGYRIIAVAGCSRSCSAPSMMSSARLCNSTARERCISTDAAGGCKTTRSLCGCAFAFGFESFCQLELQKETMLYASLLHEIPNHGALILTEH